MAALVRAQCHRCLARWVGVRSQSDCDCCAGGGDVRCANFAIDGLCACCRRVPARVRCDMLVYARAQMSSIRMFELFESRGLMYSQDSIIDFRSTDTHMQGTVHAARGRSTSRVASDSSDGPTPRPERRRSEFTQLEYRVKRAGASKTPPDEPS